MISAVATSLVLALLAPAGSFPTAPTDPVVPPPPPKVSAVSWAIYDETADVMLFMEVYACLACGPVPQRGINHTVRRNLA